MISIIVAMSQNRVIGREGTLPWHLPEDLKRFKQITMGHPIIMGRKTFESLGKPLPGRENIVVTHHASYQREGIRVVASLNAAVAGYPPDEELFVIGGAQLFAEALPKTLKIYLTLIDDEFEGDVFFPEIDLQKEFFIIEKSEEHLSEKTGLPYQFITAVRKTEKI